MRSDFDIRECYTETLMKTTTALLLVVLLTAGVSAKQSPGRTESVPFKRGHDITTVVGRAGKTETIEVVKKSLPPFIAPVEDGFQEIRSLTAKADAITVVRIVRQRPLLSPRRDWITTTSDAKITEVLKNAARKPVVAGQEISVAEDGGEIQIDGRKVVASDSVTRNMRTGGEYLVFWWIAPEGEWRTMGEVFTYELQGRRWVRLLRENSGAGVEGLPADMVLQQIRLSIVQGHAQ